MEYQLLEVWLKFWFQYIYILSSFCEVEGIENCYDSFSSLEHISMVYYKVLW